MEIKILDKKYKVLKPSLQQLLHLDTESELYMILNIESIIEHLVYRMFVFNNIDKICIRVCKLGKHKYKPLNKSSLLEQVSAAQKLGLYNDYETKYIKMIYRLKNKYIQDVLYDIKIEEIEEFVELNKKMNFFIEKQQVNSNIEKYYLGEGPKECKRMLLYYILFDGCLYFNNCLEHYKGRYSFGFSGRDLEKIRN